MANTLGDLSLSDMKWLGKPADPMGSMQAGQNFAAKGQAMQQSKEMFPHKLEGMTQTNNPVSYTHLRAHET